MPSTSAVKLQSAFRGAAVHDGARLAGPTRSAQPPRPARTRFCQGEKLGQAALRVGRVRGLSEGPEGRSRGWAEPDLPPTVSGVSAGGGRRELSNGERHTSSVVVDEGLELASLGALRCHTDERVPERAKKSILELGGLANSV